MKKKIILLAVLVTISVAMVSSIFGGINNKKVSANETSAYGTTYDVPVAGIALLLD